MFSKLRKKLKNWTQEITKKTEKKAPIEEIEVKKEIKKEKGEEKQKKKEKEINLPKKYNIAGHKFEPDLEKIGEIKEELEKKEKKSFIGKFTSKISKTQISEKDFESYSEELEMILLENNVALEVSEKIIKQLKETIVGKEFLKKEVEGQIKESLKDIIYQILIEPFDLIDKIREKKAENKPYVILFCGINGTGKTTTIAKLGNMLKEKKLSYVLAAGDTFRAASIEQLKKHGSNLKVEVISHEYGSDPASVGFDAIKYAEKNHLDVVLIDTAGRMHTEKNLMAQIEKVARVCKPDTKIFVGESITGNDIIEQIKTFDTSIGIDGIILSKADIDDKGGTALSVGHTTKKPILYLGTGQEYKDIQKFDRNKFVESLGL